MRPVRRPTADLMLLATVSLWALNFTVSKYILDQGFHPLAYASVRYACAALIFAGITLVWEGSLRMARSDLPLIVGCTSVLFANQLSFVYALSFTTATTVALLFGTLPIFTALFARVQRRRAAERSASGSPPASRSRGSRSSRSARAATSPPNLKGDALALLGCRHLGGLLRRDRAADAPVLAVQAQRRLPARRSLSLPLAGGRAVHSQTRASTSARSSWVGFAFAVLGPLVITNLLWFTAIDRVGPSRASLFANLQPSSLRSIALVRPVRARSPRCRSGWLWRSRAESSLASQRGELPSCHLRE